MPESTALNFSAQTLQGSAFTTYRVGGLLQEAYQPASDAEMLSLLQALHAEGRLNADDPANTLTMLGWGGNSIVATEGVAGVTIITRKLDWATPLSDTTIRMGAGVHLARAASLALKQGLTGGEYMIGIPGTIGGAVRMNAGALGQETSSLITAVRLFNLETGALEIWTPEQLGFRYRWSAINPQIHIILSADLQFAPGDAAAISKAMTASVQFRKTHHPKEPNGGSVFKNPAPDQPMGKLMDQLGAKGQWQSGGVMVSPMHGNFIINTGDGTSLDLLRLMTRMKQAVLDEFGLVTHPENLFLGSATEEENALWSALNAGNTH